MKLESYERSDSNRRAQSFPPVYISPFLFFRKSSLWLDISRRRNELQNYMQGTFRASFDITLRKLGEVLRSARGKFLLFCANIMPFFLKQIQTP